MRSAIYAECHYAECRGTTFHAAVLSNKVKWFTVDAHSVSNISYNLLLSQLRGAVL